MMVLLSMLLLICTPNSGIAGRVTDPQGHAAIGASVTLLRRTDTFRRSVGVDAEGRYTITAIEAGEYRLTAELAGFPILTRTVQAIEGGILTFDLQFAGVAAQYESVTVTADVSDLGALSPDPAQRVMIRDETLDANPGRPGMPVSIPGMPVESPAGGVKPPQYFTPGVAGDHGEPIAMFFQVGGFLFPNNLPANAHGNGYADPNVIIPVAIETVSTDGAAFNVREGNNSVNAAMTFGLRDRIDPMLRLTADYRDVDLVAAWSPENPANRFWMGFEVSYGNGFLSRLEHRKQYKGNVSKVFNFGRHQLTAYGIGYYGASFQPGLIPIGVAVPNDSIDARQREETSNGALILNDVWRLNERRQLQFSGYYRYYTLDVRPNFGDGLIRQSEHRNVNSEDVLYLERFNRHFSLLSGVDVRREAPHGLDLDRANSSGVFQPVTANNITMNFISSYVAADGLVNRFLHYNIGYREDQINVDNQDLYRSAQSFNRSASVSSPKGTVTFLPPETARYLPMIALSYGQAFHIDDPRIGTTAIAGGTLVSKARSYQMVASKSVAKTEFRLTLAHVTTAQQLARISNDTGLQQDVGPGLLRSLTATARRNFAHGFLQAIYSRADARDRLTGVPVPEAPRSLWGVLGTVDKLPLHLQARGEYEYVGRKPLGDGFQAVPVREFRGAITRPFPKQGFDVGLNVLLANGYGGQALETLNGVEQITGFLIRSYVTASFNYHFRRR